MDIARQHDHGICKTMQTKVASRVLSSYRFLGAEG